MKRLSLIVMAVLLAGCSSDKGTYDLFLIPEHHSNV